jgi:hypothetical protein
MNSFEFWAHMQEYGQMSRLWWYSFAALPAMIVAGGAYLLMLFALRHKLHPPAIFFWLLLASVPALLVFPSFYVSVSLAPALALVGAALPASPQQFSLGLARQLGADLDRVALGGVVGASLALVVLAAAALVGEVPVASPLAQQISQTLTRAMTRALGVRCAALGGEHGIVRITRGASAGSQFAVRNASIGKQEADIIITDAVVSRRHPASTSPAAWRGCGTSRAPTALLCSAAGKHGSCTATPARSNTATRSSWVRRSAARR